MASTATKYVVEYDSDPAGRVSVRTRTPAYYTVEQDAVAFADKHADQNPVVLRVLETPVYRPELAPVKATQRKTLEAVLTVLSDWVKGAKANHEALDHRGENVGEECWRLWSESDFRSMVDDTARDLGIYGITAKKKGS
jgi:hypothetical protein